MTDKFGQAGLEFRRLSFGLCAITLVTAITNRAPEWVNCTNATPFTARHSAVSAMSRALDQGVRGDQGRTRTLRAVAALALLDRRMRNGVSVIRWQPPALA